MVLESRVASDSICLLDFGLRVSWNNAATRGGWKIYPEGIYSNFCCHLFLPVKFKNGWKISSRGKNLPNIRDKGEIRLKTSILRILTYRLLL